MPNNPYGDAYVEPYQWGQEPDLEGMMFDYLYSDAPGGDADWTHEVSDGSSWMPQTHIGFEIPDKTYKMTQSYLSLVDPYHRTLYSMREDANKNVLSRDLEDAWINLQALRSDALSSKMDLERSMSTGGLSSGDNQLSFDYIRNELSEAALQESSSIQKKKYGLAYDTAQLRQQHRDDLYQVYSDWLAADPDKAEIVPVDPPGKTHDPESGVDLNPDCTGDDCDSWWEGGTFIAEGWDWLTGENSLVGSLAGGVLCMLDSGCEDSYDVGEWLDYNVWQPIGDAVEDGFEAVGDFVEGVGEAVIGGVTTIGTAIHDTLDWIFSDERLKRDIQSQGKYRGMPIYSFNYTWDNADAKPRVGFMATDVEKILPEAVKEVSGFKAVNYQMVNDFLEAGGMETNGN